MSDQWQSRQRGPRNCRRGVSRKMGTPARLCCRLTKTDGQGCPSYGPNHVPDSRALFVLFALLGLLPPFHLRHAVTRYRPEAPASGFPAGGGNHTESTRARFRPVWVATERILCPLCSLTTNNPATGRIFSCQGDQGIAFQPIDLAALRLGLRTSSFPREKETATSLSSLSSLLRSPGGRTLFHCFVIGH